MRIVINTCFGGFSISPRAIQRLAELQGRPCYFFKKPLLQGAYTPCEMPVNISRSDMLNLYAFDIPNPDELLREKEEEWQAMSIDERRAANSVYNDHCLSSRPNDRADANLVRVVEELGRAADGGFAELKIVEIPDGVEWEIDEYDGKESISETHRSWS